MDQPPALGNVLWPLPSAYAEDFTSGEVVPENRSLHSEVRTGKSKQTGADWSLRKREIERNCYKTNISCAKRAIM